MTLRQIGAIGVVEDDDVSVGNESYRSCSGPNDQSMPLVTAIKAANASLEMYECKLVQTVCLLLVFETAAPYFLRCFAWANDAV
jgi:hypothetical protein